MPVVWRRAAVGLALALLSCSSGTAPREPATASTARPPNTPSTTSSAPRFTGPCSAAAPPPAPAGPRSTVPLWQVAGGLAGPDDLLWADEALWIGELKADRVAVLKPGQPLARLPVSVGTVEGLARRQGVLYAASQRDDTVLAIPDGATSARVLLQLQPVPGQDGVDGIALAGDQLLVPDSPRGTLLWVTLDGQVVRTERGFVRPTGAWPEPDGSVLVADEYGNAAYRVRPDGSRQTLIAGLPIVDDVAEDRSGHVFVATPVVTGGRLAEIANGRATDLVSGLVAPQGIAVDGADNLYVSEEDAGRVDLAVRTFKIVPPPVVVDRQASICLDVLRAPGFTDSISLSADPGVTVLSSPGTGSRGEIGVGATCTAAAPCRVQAHAGERVDTVWIGV